MSTNFYLSCWNYDQKLQSSSISKGLLVSESLDNGEGKSNSLSWACSISSNEIMSFENLVKSLILDREEPFNTFFMKYLQHFFILDEIGKLALFWKLVFINFDSFMINIPKDLSAWLFKITDIVLWVSLHVVESNYEIQNKRINSFLNKFINHECHRYIIDYHLIRKAWHKQQKSNQGTYDFREIKCEIFFLLSCLVDLNCDLHQTTHQLSTIFLSFA